MKEENKSIPNVEATTDETFDSARELFEYFNESSPDLLEGSPLVTAIKMQSGSKFKKPTDPYAKLSADDLIDVIQTKQNKEVGRRSKIKPNTDVKHYADATQTPATRNKIQTDRSTEFTNKDNNTARTEMNSLRNKEIVTRRDERKAEVKKDTFTGNVGGTTALGPKLRLYPNDANSFVDEYLNVPAMIGDAADNFNDKFINRNTPESTVGEKAMATVGLGLSLAGGLTAKSPLSKINQLVNPLADIPIIPSRRRILPDAFDITTLPTPPSKSGMSGANSFVHAKGRMSESYGDLITREFPVSHNADLTANLDLKPYSINVDKVIQGNRVQDALYQSNLDYLRKNTQYKYIRSGDDLLSAPATQKFHNRSIMEDIPQSGDVHQNERTGELFFMPVRKYFGSKNPDVIKDVIDRLNKLPKHETNFKSIRDVVEPQMDKAKAYIRGLRSGDDPMFSKLDENPYNLKRTDKPGISSASISNAAKHIRPIMDEIVTRPMGSNLKGAQKWFDDWVNHPTTRSKMMASLGPEDKLPSSVVDYIDNYRPTIKSYPIKNQMKDMYDTLLNKKPSSNPKNDVFNVNIHKGNMGVSYNHYKTTKEAMDPNAVSKSRRDGSWVSNKYFDEVRESAAVHELTHDYFKRELLQRGGDKPIIQNINYEGLNLDKPKNELEAHLQYLAEPGEVHARIMEIRRRHKLTPDTKVTTEMASDILKGKDAKREVYGGDLHQILKPDAKGDRTESLKNLLNKMWSVGAVGTGAAVASQKETKDN